MMIPKMKLGLLLLAIVTITLTTANTFAGGIDSQGRELYRDGEVIVKYRDGFPRTRIMMNNLYGRVGVTDIQRFSGNNKNFEHLMFDMSLMDVRAVVAEIKRDPAVEYAQPNYLLYLLPMDTEPVDAVANRPAIQPKPAESRAATDPDMNRLYGLAKIKAAEAWAIERGSQDIVVAVIDTGVDYNHPDLAYNIWRNPNATPYVKTGVDPLGEEITGDVVGWDFVHNDNLPFDDHMHGTHCAGTVGAVGNDGLGISGVAQRVSIMAIKFLSGQGSGTTADAVKSIDYAVSRGAKILSNSWGGGADEGNDALEDSIERAEAAGVLFVAAAGNDGTNNDTRPMFPAAFPTANILTVAATNARDQLTFFSNYGLVSVDVGAPGSGIYSTTPNNTYRRLSGTSMSAPHVSGAAAVVWSHFPNETYQQIKERLMRFGDAIPSLQGKTVSGNRINVLKALQGTL